MSLCTTNILIPLWRESTRPRQVKKNSRSQAVHQTSAGRNLKSLYCRSEHTAAAWLCMSQPVGQASPPWEQGTGEWRGVFRTPRRRSQGETDEPRLRRRGPVTRQATPLWRAPPESGSFRISLSLTLWLRARQRSSPAHGPPGLQLLFHDQHPWCPLRGKRDPSRVWRFRLWHTKRASWRSLPLK